MTSETPRRVEWTGPEGWTVWADEDGVHIRAPKGDGLEQPDALRLVALWEEAREQMRVGQTPTPGPATPEEAAADRHLRDSAYVTKRAQRAIRREFADPTNPPF